MEAPWPPPPGSIWRMPGDHRIRQVVGFDGERVVRLRHPDGGPEEFVTQIEWEHWAIRPVPVIYDL